MKRKVEYIPDLQEDKPPPPWDLQWWGHLKVPDFVGRLSGFSMGELGALQIEIRDVITRIDSQLRVRDDGDPVWTRRALRALSIAREKSSSVRKELSARHRQKDGSRKHRREQIFRALKARVARDDLTGAVLGMLDYFSGQSTLDEEFQRLQTELEGLDEETDGNKRVALVAQIDAVWKALSDAERAGLEQR